MTKNSIALNRTLFLEDNLSVLRGLDSESVDLIATDPPFNKGQGAFEGVTKFGTHSYKDVWNWNADIHDDWVSWLRQERPNLFNMILATNSAVGGGENKSGSGMGAYLCWMAVRVLEMHRVLKPTGSLYLHCDPTASHYLKAMMDAVFGYDNFRNEIVWGRSPGRSGNLHWGNTHDIILFYAKSSNYVWRDILTPTGNKKSTSVPLTAAGTSSGESGQAWRGYDPTDIGRHWGVPKTGSFADWIDANVIPGYKDIESVHARLDALEDARLLKWSRGGTPSLRRPPEADTGIKTNDVWTDIKLLAPSAKERTGWKTQKPLALYKRIIEASSNPGDMVLDPFTGCATTCVAAEQLGRQWIAIDVDEKAAEVIRERLRREVSESMAWDRVVRVTVDPPERTDDGEPADPELILVSPRAKGRRKPVAEVRNDLKVRDGKRCQGCGWVPPYLDHLQVDHKKPRSLGGVDEMDNYALLCDPCNRVKSNKLALRDLQERRIVEKRMDMKWWDEEGRWK